MKQALLLLARILEAAMYAKNKKAVEDAKENPADTLANNGRLQHNETTFADLSRKSKRD